MSQNLSQNCTASAVFAVYLSRYSTDLRYILGHSEEKIYMKYTYEIYIWIYLYLALTTLSLISIYFRQGLKQEFKKNIYIF